MMCPPGVPCYSGSTRIMMYPSPNYDTSYAGRVRWNYDVPACACKYYDVPLSRVSVTIITSEPALEL
jgi:hypothetical protein